MTLQKEIKDRILNVRSDLIFLREEWDNEIDDHSLRRSIIVIRRLLLEKEFGMAWRDIGFKREPSINAINLEHFIGDIDLSKIRFAFAGGARYKSISVDGTFEISGILTPKEIAEFSGRNSSIDKFYLTQFIESSCIIVNGVKISRRIIIKYISYKLGGIHPVSGKRDLNNQDDQIYRLLDYIGKHYQVAEKNVIYLELLSIGQCLASSQDTDLFINYSLNFIDNM